MSRTPLSASGRPAAPSSTGSSSSSPLQASPVSELMLRFSCPGLPAPAVGVGAPPRPAVPVSALLSPGAGPTADSPSGGLRRPGSGGAAALPALRLRSGFPAPRPPLPPWVAYRLADLADAVFPVFTGLEAAAVEPAAAPSAPVLDDLGDLSGGLLPAGLSARMDRAQDKPPLFALAAFIWLVPRVGWLLLAVAGVVLLPHDHLPWVPRSVGGGRHLEV